MMLQTYDADADAMYLKLRDGKIARTEELDGWAYVDVDADGQAVGIEVIHPARNWPVGEAIRRYQITGTDRALLEAMYPQAGDPHVRRFTSPRIRLSASAQTVCPA